MDASEVEALDIVSVGELVVDFISVEQIDTLGNAKTFRRHLGGSPANIAVYVSKLGGAAAVVSKTGIGAFGKFLKSQLARHGVITEYLVMDHRTNTTIVFVSSTSGTPDFKEFRSGDYLLSPGEVSEEAIDSARVVHSSAFALSREPCRSAVYEAFRLAREGGKVVSFDPNYSRRVWPDHKEARRVLPEVYKYVDITKPSLDDAGRIFGREYEPEEYLRMFHEMGPITVILTMGKDGTLVSENGRISGHVPARPVEVHDATGAGDAFWAGFLTAMLDGERPMRCALFAREVAEMKLEQVGPLPNDIDRGPIYARLEEIAEKGTSPASDGAR
ncbi:MAG: putative carbohydrate kinase [Rubrobacteraceae bacterium]|nr:putative carbohydrate kinase [Rubrobacteraceae bacterium]